MRALPYILFIFAAHSSFGQEWETWHNTREVATTDHEYCIPTENASTSPFRQYQMADSFSSKKDSINASNYFSKIDPYYFICENVNPEIMDTILNNRNLTIDARNKYKQLFTTAFSGPQTEAFQTFKSMYEEDQAQRDTLSLCKDSLTYARYSIQMIKSDSIHFDYLYRFVKHKDWPDQKNGSRYAILLAIHDHAKYDFYIPIIIKAVEDGIVALSALQLMIGWQQMSQGHIAKMMKSKDKVAVDISPILDEKMPAMSKMKAIKQAIKEHCPVKELTIAFECRDVTYFNHWWLNYKTNNAAFKQSAMSDFFIALEKTISDQNKDPKNTCRRISEYNFKELYVKSELPRPRLMLYIVY